LNRLSNKHAHYKITKGKVDLELFLNILDWFLGLARSVVSDAKCADLTDITATNTRSKQKTIKHKIIISKTDTKTGKH